MDELASGPRTVPVMVPKLTIVLSPKSPAPIEMPVAPLSKPRLVMNAPLVVVPVPVSDTVKRVADGNSTHVIVETLPRERIYLAQTPQAFRRAILGEAVALGRRGVEATDEAALAEHAGHRVHIVNGEPSNVKITTAGDLESARARTDRADGSTATARIGVGYDLHRLVEGRPLILGGVTVPSDRGALGHSDADVVCHAVTDAILGAGRAGDIGQHFPDTDARWKDASSLALLRAALAIVSERGWIVENVDVVVVLERPRLAPFRPAIEEQLARALEVADEAVSASPEMLPAVLGAFQA